MEYKYQDWTIEHLIAEEHMLRDSRARALLALAEFYDKAIAENLVALREKMREAV